MYALGDAPSEDLGGSCAEAVLLGAHHLDDLPPASEEMAQTLSLRRREASSGGGTHGLGETSEDLGIESIGVGEPTRGASEVPGLCVGLSTAT
jgi:hypothetical protein